MAFQPEVATYDSGVYQLEVVDPVDGGVGAVSNKPLLNLANRTKYLKAHVDALETASGTLAPINSPNFTGTPTGPTPGLGDNSTKFATTAFVQNTVSGILNKNVAGGSTVTLTTVEAGNGILNFIGLLTANIAVIVPGGSDKWTVRNQTTGAFSLTVKTASGTGVVVAQGKQNDLWCDATNVIPDITDFNSTAFSGVPTAPTGTTGDVSTQLATNQFAQTAADNSAIVYALIL
jgi:hypothetical protein